MKNMPTLKSIQAGNHSEESSKFMPIDDGLIDPYTLRVNPGTILSIPYIKYTIEELDKLLRSRRFKKKGSKK